MPSYGPVTVDHKCSVEDAVEQLRSFLGNLAQQNDQVKVEKESWEGSVLDFAFTYSGQKIEGRMTVAEDNVTVEGPLSFLLVAFKGRIEETIKQEICKVLEGCCG